MGYTLSTHKGTSAVKISKLQMLMTKFGNIMMHENKKFSSLYYELSVIVNSSFNLGEAISYSIVRKLLKSFLERFRPKVIVIEESKDIDSMRID